jgi:MFS family permease
MVLFAWLYASEGAPIGFIWWALPVLLRDIGLETPAITSLTALLVLPWIGKFLWAPLVDALRTARIGFRQWILGAQTLMGVALLPLLWIDPADHLRWWMLFLLLHGFAAATQDVAIDALAINSVPPSERGSVNGAMLAGKLIGRSLFGGGSLMVAGAFGLPGLFLCLIAFVWLCMTAMLFIHEPVMPTPHGGAFAEFGRHLVLAFRQRATWLGLAFALTSAAGFEAAGALAGPYFIDRSIPRETIGCFFGLVVVVATVGGGLLGGKLSDRFGRVPSVAAFLVGFVLVITTAGLMDQRMFATQPSTTAILTLFGLMYFFYGLFIAASYALFMDLTNPRIGGTQFSTFMAATNGCESWSAAVGGRIVGEAGRYGMAFIVMSLVSLLSLSILLAIARVRARRITTG